MRTGIKSSAAGILRHDQPLINQPYKFLKLLTKTNHLCFPFLKKHVSTNSNQVSVLTASQYSTRSPTVCLSRCANVDKIIPHIHYH